MSWNRTIYRKCKCGETAFDAKFDSNSKSWTWLCRNCREPALDRKGVAKSIREHDRPGSSERGPG